MGPGDLLDIAQREADAAKRKLGETRRRLRLATLGDPEKRFENIGEEEEHLFLSGAPTSDCPTVIDGGPRRVKISHPLSVSVPAMPTVRVSRSFNLKREFSLSAIPHRGAEWRWLNTVAFFVGATFVIGATLFTVGAAVACLANPIVAAAWGIHVREWQEHVIVAYTYLIGHMYFVAGAYLGWFEVINVGQANRILWAGPEEGSSASGYWGALFYFLGTVPPLLPKDAWHASGKELS